MQDGYVVVVTRDDLQRIVQLLAARHASGQDDGNLRLRHRLQQGQVRQVAAGHLQAVRREEFPQRQTTHRAGRLHEIQSQSLRMLVDLEMLLVSQLQKGAVLAVGSAERMGRVVGVVHLRISQFFVQVALGHLHGVHRTQVDAEDLLAHGARHQVDNQLSYVDRAVVVLSDFSNNISTHCFIIFRYGLYSPASSRDIRDAPPPVGAVHAGYGLSARTTRHKDAEATGNRPLYPA